MNSSRHAELARFPAASAVVEPGLIQAQSPREFLLLLLLHAPGSWSALSQPAVEKWIPAAESTQTGKRHVSNLSPKTSHACSRVKYFIGLNVHSLLLEMINCIILSNLPQGHYKLTQLPLEVG